MAKKSGLGSVLDSIFDDDYFGGDDVTAKGITTLKIGDIEPNRSQPREHFDNEKLTSLAETIAIHGIFQPLTVRPFGGGYQIVAGERRWRAARMAGLDEVPVYIIDLTDAETMQVALIENLQREDLNPLEEARGYSVLIENFDMKQEDVAKNVGKARSSITNSLRLLTLPDTIKELVKSGELSKGHCKALLGLTDQLQMIQLAQKSVSGGLSVRALEKIVQKETSPKKEEPNYRKTPLYAEAEIALSNTLGKPVRVKESAGKATIEIDTFSEDEFIEIVKRLTGEWNF